MKLSVVLAALALASGVAFADEPTTEPPSQPDDETTPDEPGTPGENDVAPTPAPAPSATPSQAKARLMQPVPHASLRARPKDDGESRLDKQEDTVAGGKHWRIKTAQGAVHVWVPDGYDRATAGTVIYVHGYYVDADTAWREYGLARQFRASHQNAMFIVPEAPAGNDDSVNWPALKDLRRAVSRANLHLPDGPVIVMGHSGAFRTIMQWVDHKLVEQIILLDAMYAGESAFDAFIKSGKRADQHKLIVVAAGTAQTSESFAKSYKFAVARENMPTAYSGFTKRERGAKLLYIHSQFEHYAIVTSHKVIPLLLRLTALKSL